MLAAPRQNEETVGTRNHVIRLGLFPGNTKHQHHKPHILDSQHMESQIIRSACEAHSTCHSQDLRLYEDV